MIRNQAWEDMRAHCQGRRCKLRSRQAGQGDGPDARQPTPTRGIGLGSAGWGECGARNAVGVAWGTPNDVGLQSLAHALQHGRAVCVVEEAGESKQVSDGPEGVACSSKAGNTPCVWCQWADARHVLRQPGARTWARHSMQPLGQQQQQQTHWRASRCWRR